MCDRVAPYVSFFFLSLSRLESGASCVHASVNRQTVCIESSIASLLVILGVLYSFPFSFFFFSVCRSKRVEERDDATATDGIVDSSIDRCHDGSAHGKTCTLSSLGHFPPPVNPSVCLFVCWLVGWLLSWQRNGVS